MKKFVNLFVSIVFIAGALSACGEQEFDDLQSDRIASIGSQISSIQASIASLEKIEAELKSRIETLESSDVDTHAQEISALKEAEASLSQRITELKTYVDDELKKQKDWVSATFSTLEQYQSTLDEIAVVKQNISDLETTLKGLVSDTETSVKGWVNEQLTGYYTIAEMNAKISALEKAITDGDDAQAEELEKLRSDLETAKAEIKAAYEKAIADAITEFEGKITKKIAADIKTATDALQSQIDEINTKITDIETRLGLIEESLEKILARVQSIVVVPTYSDGSVQLKISEDTEILFEVSPRSAAIALAEQGSEVFSIDVISVQTKASMFVGHLPVKSVQDNGECLVVTVDAAQMDTELFDSYPQVMARLKIDDGTSSMTTAYFALSPDYIDLGLSVKWAMCNLGANAPEEYGDYYSWGKIETYYSSGQDPLTWKEDGTTGYDWESYKWCEGSSTTLTKYNTSSYFGTVDGKTELDPEDDVAHVKRGGSWRMPTDAEWTELLENCTWTWTTRNGVNGYKVSSEINGNSIFLPAAGSRDFANLYDAGSYGDYWSSSLNAVNPDHAWDLYFNSEKVSRFCYDRRCFGFSVRPVTE